MNRKQVEETTFKHHQSGLCCSEAIIRSVTETYAEESSSAIPEIGSGFCKGIGKTGEDICGTVTGGVIALGYIFGRMTRDDDNAPVCEFAAEFRKRFIAKYGTTNCGELLKKFGQQEDMGKCKCMTADAAGMIASMLSRKAEL